MMAVVFTAKSKVQGQQQAPPHCPVVCRAPGSCIQCRGLCLQVLARESLSYLFYCTLAVILGNLTFLILALLGNLLILKAAPKPINVFPVFFNQGNINASCLLLRVLGGISVVLL